MDYTVCLITSGCPTGFDFEKDNNQQAIEAFLETVMSLRDSIVIETAVLKRKDTDEIIYQL